ncbi:serine/threonine protein kinase [Hyalangium versicolor]|uniref:serine/threonine protein kinase n=1 Tax=Hyalangium versicolor TaxID=2861190 RepID=UPI001CCE3F9A|nr:serine/threonine protein kinase [Hyalangium versicolor]
MAQQSNRPEMLIPGTCVEHWRVLECLSQHADGALYRVEDTRRSGEPLVMRLSSRRSDGQCGDRNARLQAAHPNIARLHGYGRWPARADGFFYCIREDVRGQTLARWVETHNPTFLQIAALLNRVATALDELHVRDTWHREVHPDNLLVRDEDAEPVLLDLRAGGNECLGTLLHMPLPQDMQVFRSPEALRFLRTNLGRDHARYHFRPTDDLYSLGALAYWLVTGHPPFSPSLPTDQLHAEIELRAPLPPWEVNERVPKPLGAIILRLMSKLPEARPHSGESLCAELMVAVSAGARSMWARRVFDWAPDELGAEMGAQRIRRPAAPPVSPLPGPRLPRVVHFTSPFERRGPPLRSAPKGDRSEPLSPWARMM